MNIDFSADPGFSLYVVLLALSGVLMVGIGATRFSQQSVGWRIFNVIAGLAFFGYAFYLAFIFAGGTYVIFFKAFILPAFMVFKAIRSAVTRDKTPAPLSPQNGWAGPQQPSWAVPEQPSWGTPQQTPQQSGWNPPQQSGGPVPQQHGWADPQQTPQQPGGPVPQQGGWASPQQTPQQGGPGGPQL